MLASMDFYRQVGLVQRRYLTNLWTDDPLREGSSAKSQDIPT